MTTKGRRGRPATGNHKVTVQMSDALHGWLEARGRAYGRSVGQQAKAELEELRERDAQETGAGEVTT